MFTLPELPFAKDALAPHMSEDTLNFHHGKHHKTYVDNLNKLTEGTDWASMDLEEIIKKSYGKSEHVGIFNNAAQVWNHTFFWHCLSPNGGGEPKGHLAERIEKDFGSYKAFRDAFKQAALTQFGSGWAWLVDDNGTLKIEKTPNADTPLARGQKALLTLDVWEHAYYLDFQNRRPDFVDNFFDNLVNWDFVASKL
jgi:Fe-Mn family superoxide dismutase